MELKIKALSPKIGHEIPAPFYASAGAAAMDLHACLDEPLAIPAGQRRSVPTGLAIALLGEKVTKLQGLSLLVAVLGAGIIIGKPTAGVTPLGMGICVFALFSWAYATIHLKKLTAHL